MRAVYHIHQILEDEVLIFDDYDPQNPTMSVTNDVEAVLWDLKMRGYLRPKVFYKDTEGQIDEIVHDNGKFVSFKPLRQNINP